MRHSINMLVTTLALSSMLATPHVSAEQPVSSTNDWPLGMTIAMQGDNALVQIQTSVTRSISQSISKQLETALPTHHASHAAADSEHIESKFELPVLMASH